MQAGFGPILNRFLLCPPLRPWVLALASLPWLGLGGAPFVFPLFFPLFFGPFLVEGVHAVNCFGAILWLKPLRFSIAQVAKLLCGIGRPTLALKTSNDNATSVTPPIQIPTSIWAW